MEVFTNYDILSAVAQDMKPSTQKRKGKEDIITFVPFLLLYKHLVLWKVSWMT